MKLVVDKDIPYFDTFIKDIDYYPSFEILKYKDSEFSSTILKDADALFIRSTTTIKDDSLEDSNIRFIASATSGYNHICKSVLEWNCNEKKCFIASGCNSFAVVNYILSCVGYLIAQNKFSKSNSVGIIGFGSIGTLLAETLDNLAIKNFFFDPYVLNSLNPKKKKSLEDILDCDLVTIHASYSRNGDYPSHRLLGKHNLLNASLKTLINSSRGEIIDEKFISEQNYFDYIADVWIDEPDCDEKLVEKALLSTPHIAGYSNQAKHQGTKSVICEFAKFFGFKNNLLEREKNIKFVKNEKLFEEDFKVNNFPCKFMKSLFDIETCSNEFKNSFLMRKMSFDMLRESFNFVDDFSCYKLNKSSKNDNNLLKKFLPMEKIN